MVLADGWSRTRDLAVGPVFGLRTTAHRHPFLAFSGKVGFRFENATT
jgi:hypothetical protein